MQSFQSPDDGALLKFFRGDAHNISRLTQACPFFCGVEGGLRSHSAVGGVDVEVILHAGHVVVEDSCDVGVSMLWNDSKAHPAVYGGF